MKYFKIYDIIYVKQKTVGILIVTGLYPNETDRKRSGTRAPLRMFVESYWGSDTAVNFLQASISKRGR